MFFESVSEQAPSGLTFLDRRDRQRSKFGVRVRFALPDGSEHEVTALDISTTSVAFEAPAPIAIGITLVADLQDIGLVGGTVTDVAEGRVVLTLSLNDQKRGRLARRLKMISGALSQKRASAPAHYSREADGELFVPVR